MVINISTMKTTRQQERETLKSSAPFQASTIPMINANAPARGDPVASNIAGKVITARVT